MIEGRLLICDAIVYFPKPPWYSPLFSLYPLVLPVIIVGWIRRPEVQLVQELCQTCTGLRAEASAWLAAALSSLCPSTPLLLGEQRVSGVLGVAVAADGLTISD